jgi:hypothetical protein
VVSTRDWYGLRTRRILAAAARNVATEADEKTTTVLLQWNR